MADALTCEKLIVEGNRRKMPSYPYRCGRKAVRYRVLGNSFDAYSILCTVHRKCAEREGFRMMVAHEQ